MAEHHCRVKLVGVHIAFGGDQHVTNHAQALHIGVEGAQPIREFFWEHRDNTPREIHAGGALVGIHIDGTSGAHVMAYIGNRDQQTPSFAAPHFGRFTIDRVIKITRIFTINGHQRNVGQVNAVQFVLRSHFVWQRARQSDTSIRKFMRHAVFANRNFNLHAWVVNLTQNFFHAAYRLPKKRWWLGQLHHHHLTGFAGPDGQFGNQHILTITFVFWGHDPDATLMQQAANDRMNRTFNDLNYAAFWTAFSVLTHDANLDAIFVQNGPHFVRRQVNIAHPVIA